MTNVKIQYTVELEDLPLEIGKIINSCYKTADDFCSELSIIGNGLCTPTDVEGHTKNLKKILKSQAKILNRLDEMVHILEAYEKIKNLTPEDIAKLQTQTQQPEKQEFTDS